MGWVAFRGHCANRTRREGMEKTAVALSLLTPMVCASWVCHSHMCHLTRLRSAWVCRGSCVHSPVCHCHEPEVTK